MKRRLVIYNEAKRHWFRQMLPAAALTVAQGELVANTARRENVKLFMLSYTAALFAFSLYLI